MSTRCTVHFCDKPSRGKPKAAAIVYRHCDGYPESMEPDLKRFFADVKEQTPDTRFHDSCYLAAKFIVWQAAQNVEYSPYKTGKPLDFISLGVMMKDPMDIEWRYKVLCYDNDEPKVITEKVRDY